MNAQAPFYTALLRCHERLVRSQGFRLRQSSVNHQKKEEWILERSKDLSLNLIPSSLRPSLRKTFSAIHWSASIRLEGDFTFLSAISTYYLMHLFLVHQLFQLLVECCKKLCSLLTSSCTLFHQLQRLIKVV